LVCLRLRSFLIVDRLANGKFALFLLAALTMIPELVVLILPLMPEPREGRHPGRGIGPAIKGSSLGVRREADG